MLNFWTSATSVIEKENATVAKLMATIYELLDKFNL
jgi:hypothetical protein